MSVTETYGNDHHLHAENHDHLLATANYQLILDSVALALPYPEIRTLLAECAINDPGTLLHQLRVYYHGIGTIQKLSEIGLIKDDVKKETLEQFKLAILHDLGKSFVGETLEKSKTIMSGTTYNPHKDDRTLAELAQMASHAPAGAFAFNLFLLLYSPSLSKETVSAIDNGMLHHHSSLTPIFSDRGIKISYMDEVFAAKPGMNMLTNLLINLEDVNDAMVYPRKGRDAGLITPTIISSELTILMQNERVEAAFNCKSSDVEKIKLALLPIITSLDRNVTHLTDKPDITKLTWGHKPFIQEKDYQLTILRELSELVWSRHGQELTEARSGFEKLYQEKQLQ